MYAEYDFRKKPSNKKDEKEQLLYPRIVSKGTISSKQIVEEISEESSFTQGDIEGVLILLEKKVSNYLVKGYHVQVSRLGFFSAKLKARPVTDKKEIRACSVSFDNINFRPSAWFRAQTRGFVKRAVHGFRHSADIPEKERRSRLEKYLNEHPFITRSDYSLLTGLLKNKALTELNTLVKEGVLESTGSGSHKVYIRPLKKEKEYKHISECKDIETRLERKKNRFLPFPKETSIFAPVFINNKQMELPILYQIFLDCNSVTTDSRNCPQGSLFIALKGESFNGNAFAAQALKDGCAYAVVDEPEYAPADDKRYILVKDCLQTLQELANYHRKQLRTRIIAITGTNGKTTTKELISTVLSQKYNILYTQGNLNNHIGVPLTLLRLKTEHELAVIEMGANHPGEIKFLANMVEPDYGLITNVGKAHLEGFGSFKGVIKTKGELYDFLRSKEDAVIFIHHDNPYLMDIAMGLEQIPYGSEDSLYINGHVTENSPYLSFQWKAGKEGEQHEVHTRLIGEYNLPNMLAAVAIGHFFGVEAYKINNALETYTPQNNRSQLKQTANNTLIIDAYNANPTSMIAALKNFRNIKAEHKMIILGDMRELGTESHAEHQKIIDFVNECDFEKVWLVGEQFAATRQNYRTFANASELIRKLETDKPIHFTILIKGSNGTRLSTITDYL